MIQFKRGTSTAWTSANPVLQYGQPGYDLTNNQIRVGDGTTPWLSLTPVGGSGGVPDGDKGDITVSGGGTTWTIDNGVVTLSKMANLAASTILGNNTGASATPIALTPTQVKTLLAIASSDVSGLAPIATSGSASDLTTGTLPAARFDDTAHGTRAGGTLHAAATTSVAGFMSSADKTKLDGVATGATANSPDATLLARANHTGTQLASTISDFASAVAATAAVTANTAKVSNATHTGDVTGSTALTITNDAVTNAKLANMAANTIKGNNTGSAADPVDLTVAQVKTLLAYTAADVGAQPVDADLTALAALTGTNTIYYRSAADTWSPVTIGANLTFSAGTLAAAGGGGATDLGYTASTRLLTSSTGADVTLPIVTSTDAGLAPASGGGTTNFLRADGIWAAPAGGGGGVSDGDKGDVVVSGGGTVWAVESAAGNFNVGGSINLPAVSTPSVPSAGNVKLFGRSVAGRILPAIIGPSGIDTALQAALSTNRISIFAPNGNATTVTTLGGAYTALGAATAANVATTNRFTRMRGIEYLVTTAATTAVVGLRATANQWTVGAATAGDGGFFSVFRWGPATGVATATSRAFCGMRSATAPSDIEPSTITNIVGMGWDAADTNIQMMHNDATGTATKINLGASFPVPTVDRTSVYEVALFSPPGTTQSVGYRVTDLVSGAEASGTITTDLPTNTTLIAPHLYMSVGGTSSVVGVKVFSQYIETDY